MGSGQLCIHLHTFTFTNLAKMTNTTHTDEIEIVQLYYLVPGCVVSMFKNYIYQSEYVSMVR